MKVRALRDEGRRIALKFLGMGEELHYLMRDWPHTVDKVIGYAALVVSKSSW